MLSWHFVTAAEYYAAAGSYDENKLYFLSDTHEIYKGATPFTEGVVMIDDAQGMDTALQAVTNPARRKIYIGNNTLEGRVYTGTEWKTVIRAVDTAVTESSDKLITSGAVFAHVAAEIGKVTGGTGFVKSVSYDKATHSLSVTGGEGAQSIELDGFAVEVAYDKGTGALTLKDSKGEVLGQTVNLDLERFVSAAAYDHNTKEILLAFNDIVKIDTGAYTYPGTMPADPTAGTACRAGGKWYVYTDQWAEVAEDKTPLAIEVGALVDTYTAEDSDTVSMTVMSNKFKANVKLDSTKGENLIQSSENGLYVAPVSLDACMKLVDAAVENNLATFGAGGQVKDSGKAIGGETMKGTTDANTLATEKAVEAAINAAKAALTEAINGKIAKVGSAVADNLPILTGDGQLRDSGKKIGGAALDGTPTENTLATEKAVKAAIDEATADVLRDADKKNALASGDNDDTVPTSKAVVDAMSWKTTM